MTQNNQLAMEALMVARTQLGVREATGNNDGRQVAVYQQFVEHHNVHEPWCADFASWCIYQAAADLRMTPKLQKTASAPNLYAQARAIGLTLVHPQPGCLGFVSVHGSIEHVFFVTGVNSGGVQTIEGNCDNQVKANQRSLAGLLFCGVA